MTKQPHDFDDYVVEARAEHTGQVCDRVVDFVD